MLMSTIYLGYETQSFFSYILGTDSCCHIVSKLPLNKNFESECTMPPEIITTKRDTEIGRLLERVIRDHRKDISAFSKG